MGAGSDTAIVPGEHTLLVVDDVEDNRDLLSRWLRKRGFQVITAADGPAALAALVDQAVDLVLLDVTMPGMSGLDVLREIRQRAQDAELPVIMVTARGRSEHVVEALDLGANDYVTKPLDFAVLYARVLAALRSSRAGRRRAARPTGPLGPGTVLAGRYELARKIGEGGFGAVFEARHRDLQRSVAVKILRTPSVDADAIARFRREGINACRVQHPNALAVLDSGVTDDGVAFLVMELLDGHPLEQELERSWLSFQRCADIIAPVCEALAAAHAADIVHRDIKPGNIFLHRGPDGEVPKVLDFGIAKLVGASVLEQKITVEGWIVGTPAYMAPERFGITGYDGKSDVYSIGVLLYQMFTGALPFQATAAGTADDPLVLAMLHRTEQAVPLRAIEPDAPAGLEALVHRTLAKRPEDRPTASELADELRAAVAGLPELRTLMRTPTPASVRKAATSDTQQAAVAMPTMPMRVGGNNDGGE
ncbi:MAG: protein kinase [Kofleriaceae bacterium]|nr:protein kinase [Kofleriaceae bacterium]MCB9575034.1 protein kinase [Kofleriaceae bacterium]